MQRQIHGERPQLALPARGAGDMLPAQHRDAVGRIIRPSGDFKGEFAMLRTLALGCLLAVCHNRGRADEPAPANPVPADAARDDAQSAPDSIDEPSEARDKLPPPQRPCVGTVDMERAFAQHKWFHERCAELRVKVAEAEADLSRGREKLAALEKEREAATPGSAIEKSLLERLSTENALLQVDVDTRKEDFKRIEARYYRKAFEDILRAIARQADERGMRLVIRAEGGIDSVDGSPEKILKALNNTVLFQNGIDLTDSVITAVNGETEAEAASGYATRPSDNAADAASAVATLDLVRVYNEDITFRGLNEALKADVQRAEFELARRRRELQQDTDILANIEKGSDAYREKEVSIRKRRAVMDGITNARKMEFVAQEARMYYEVFQGIADELARLAEKKGFTLVLRTGESSCDTENYEELKKQLNKKWVLYQRDISVTDEVIAARRARARAE